MKAQIEIEKATAAKQELRVTVDEDSNVHVEGHLSYDAIYTLHLMLVEMLNRLDSSDMTPKTEEMIQ